MANMDIFEGDAFTIIELTRALENIPFKPAILSGAGLFGARGVRTRDGWVRQCTLVNPSERRIRSALLSNRWRKR